jgi:lipopolysaccharide/colanic/teichoic acid biosynthesis glycosyltransferase
MAPESILTYALPLAPHPPLPADAQADQAFEVAQSALQQEVSPLLRETDSPHAKPTNGTLPVNRTAPRLNGWAEGPLPTLPTGYPPVPYRWYGWVKTAVEFASALLLFVVTAPLVLLAAVLVKWTSPGPAFYSQIRLGKHGRPFKIHKLRTMYHNCEALSGPCWARPGDPRVTWVGNFLRKSHVDELPQLVNVLLGQMSLIGPRPERPEFLPKLEQTLPRYRQRLAVRPGVTGLAQVQLPSDTDLDSVRRKLAYDLYYIRQLGPWLELRIVLGTLGYVLGIPFAVSRRLFLLPASEIVERAGQPA